MMTNQLMKGDYVRVAYMDEPQIWYGVVEHEHDNEVFVTAGALTVKLTCMEHVAGGILFRDETTRIATVEVVPFAEYLLNAQAKQLLWMHEQLAAAMALPSYEEIVQVQSNALQIAGALVEEALEVSV